MTKDKITDGNLLLLAPQPDDEETVNLKEARYILSLLNFDTNYWSLSDVLEWFKVQEDNKFYYAEGCEDWDSSYMARHFPEDFYDE